jgi:hypothetical protein
MPWHHLHGRRCLSIQLIPVSLYSLAISSTTTLRVVERESTVAFLPVAL